MRHRNASTSGFDYQYDREAFGLHVPDRHPFSIRRVSFLRRSIVISSSPLRWFAFVPWCVLQLFFFGPETVASATRIRTEEKRTHNYTNTNQLHCTHALVGGALRCGRCRQLPAASASCVHHLLGRERSYRSSATSSTAGLIAFGRSDFTGRGPRSQSSGTSSGA